MDKLELDARVARLERRYGLILALLVAVPAGVLLLLFGFARVGRVESAAVAAPFTTPPPAVEWVEKAATPAPEMPMMGMIGGMGGMMMSDSMMGLAHELGMLKQLRDESVITEAEWQAKKGQALAKELHPGDLRSDLELVQQLSAQGAIGEEERAALRTRLLGIEGQTDEGRQDH